MLTKHIILLQKLDLLNFLAILPLTVLLYLLLKFLHNFLRLLLTRVDNAITTANTALLVVIAAITGDNDSLCDSIRDTLCTFLGVLDDCVWGTYWLLSLSKLICNILLVLKVTNLLVRLSLLDWCMRKSHVQSMYELALLLCVLTIGESEVTRVLVVIIVRLIDKIMVLLVIGLCTTHLVLVELSLGTIE